MKRLRRFFALFILSLSFAIAPVFSDQLLLDREGKEVRIVPVKSADEIDYDQSKDLLVRSFLRGYEDVPLVELNPDFRSIGDMRRFYEGYFDSELEHYSHGGLVWIQAFQEEKLVGWATFELEKIDAAYMNLLIVDPDAQGRGIGKHLTFSIRSLYPEVQDINLLIRKVNIEGWRFYQKIGFKNSEYKRENFIDTSLLSGMSWSIKNER